MSKDKKLSLSVPVQFTKVDGDPHEGTFQKMKVRICSPGKNRNFSYISKEELDAAKPTLAYVPVVGRIYEKIDESGEVVGHYFGGHDYEVDDNFEWRPTTVPYGVMTVEEPWYESVNEFGKDVEYLCGYCYLWVGRWPELKDCAWDESFWYSQSMEMNFKDYSIYAEDSNFVEFHGCRFDAICILGYDPDNAEYNTTPCFPSAGFVPATEFSLNSAQFSQLMGELKDQLAASFENKDSHRKGGNGLTSDNVNMGATEVTPDQAQVENVETCEAENIENAGADAGTVAMETEVATAAEPASETGDPGEQVEMAAGEESAEGDKANFETFSMTYRERQDVLCKAVSALGYVREDNGQCVEELYCWLMDFDDEYVYYSADHWVPGNYESKNFRSTYAISADGNVAVGEGTEVFSKWLTAEEIQKMDAEKEQLTALIKFKADTEAAANSAKVESMLSEFSDLANLDEFASIKDEAEKAENPDVANFELRLFALRGKMATKPAVASNKSTVKVGIDADEIESADDGYGGLLNRVHNRNK